MLLHFDIRKGTWPVTNLAPEICKSFSCGDVRDLANIWWLCKCRPSVI